VAAGAMGTAACMYPIAYWDALELDRWFYLVLIHGVSSLTGSCGTLVVMAGMHDKPLMACVLGFLTLNMMMFAGSSFYVR
jgi:hypothetical protein